MKLKHTAQTSLAALRTHPMRSSLTILGIVIGIASIIVVMALGLGAQELILGQIQGMGSKTVVVVPGRQPKGPSDFAQVLSDSLKEKDIAALEKKVNVPTLARLMPVVIGAASAQRGSETYRPTIMGATGLLAEIFDLSVGEGAFFTDEDVKARASVIVIGAKVKKELFGLSDAIGQTIKVKEKNFRVIGVLPTKGQVSFFNFDEIVLLPYTTAQQYVFGIKHFHRLIIEAAAEDTVARTARDVTTTLRESHGIRDPDKDDFFIETQADVAARLETIMSALTAFLAAVAAISLVVGGIGIMNIMLVSVTERTREIGLRKAIGATDRDIMTQFLLEAVFLTAIGGVFGILMGASVAFFAAFVIRRFAAMGFAFTFPLSAVALGLGVATTVGLIFGLYPARQAAQKNPIEALRYE